MLYSDYDGTIDGPTTVPVLELGDAPTFGGELASPVGSPARLIPSMHDETSPPHTPCQLEEGRSY